MFSTEPSVTVHEVHTSDSLREVLSMILPQSRTGDWRPDVIGVDKLSLQAGYDGWPLINGHRVTEEMCAALKADRPEQAGNFVFENLVAMAGEMGSHDPSGLAAGGSCPDTRVDHEDGTSDRPDQ
ncbi:hypothetical protein AB0D11_36895 [Streptomyces monashensis]|uniref:hypothetical protein n=1 Tax=Streptomyces monashensis TaxID=1678012 RepID=UPI0033EEAB96